MTLGFTTKGYAQTKGEKISTKENLLELTEVPSNINESPIEINYNAPRSLSDFKYKLG